MSRLRYALQIVAAVALLLAAGWATGVIKVDVRDSTPTVHRAAP